MADEREDIQTPGRKANAARPLNEADAAQGSKGSRPVQEPRGGDARGALAQTSGTSNGGDAG